ncbi:MAG: hypothetical protein ACW990_00220 [Promethearchaeota archaeon]|jgi:hypothetical protein
MRNIYLYFIGNIEFFYGQIVYYSLVAIWFVILAYLSIIEKVMFIDSLSGLIVLLVTSYLYLKWTEKLSVWFKWYFVSHSLAVLDNLPEGIGFNIKRMGTELFGKNQGWNNYNELKGYSSKTLRFWIMFGKYQIIWKKNEIMLGHEFNFDISYLGKAWFDENFQKVGLPDTGENIVKEARKTLSKSKRYDLLYKYDMIDEEGKLKTGEKKY